MKIEELLDIAGMNSLVFKLESPIYIDNFKKLLESESWEKIYTEEDSEWAGFGNFIVEYKKGPYRAVLFCDPDGYVFKVDLFKEDK